jgi:hypothetical protein
MGTFGEEYGHFNSANTCIPEKSKVCKIKKINIFL